MDNQYYTLEEVSDSFGIGEEELRRSINKGELPVYRVGGSKVCVSKEDLEKFLDRATIEAIAPIGEVDEVIIISRHKGAVEWLNRRGIFGHVLERASRKDVQGKIVYGVLPIHLGWLAKEWHCIDIPFAPNGSREDMSAADMDRLGARLIQYYDIKRREE